MDQKDHRQTAFNAQEGVSLIEGRGIVVHHRPLTVVVATNDDLEQTAIATTELVTELLSEDTVEFDPVARGLQSLVVTHQPTGVAAVINDGVEPIVFLFDQAAAIEGSETHRSEGRAGWTTAFATDDTLVLVAGSAVNQLPALASSQPSIATWTNLAAGTVISGGVHLSLKAVAGHTPAGLAEAEATVEESFAVATSAPAANVAAPPVTEVAAYVPPVDVTADATETTPNTADQPEPSMTSESLITETAADTPTPFSIAETAADTPTPFSIADPAPDTPTSFSLSEPASHSEASFEWPSDSGAASFGSESANGADSALDLTAPTHDAVAKKASAEEAKEEIAPAAEVSAEAADEATTDTPGVTGETITDEVAEEITEEITERVAADTAESATEVAEIIKKTEDAKVDFSFAADDSAHPGDDHVGAVTEVTSEVPAVSAAPAFDRGVKESNDPPAAPNSTDPVTEILTPAELSKQLEAIGQQPNKDSTPLEQSALAFKPAATTPAEGTGPESWSSLFGDDDGQSISGPPLPPIPDPKSKAPSAETIDITTGSAPEQKNKPEGPGVLSGRPPMPPPLKFSEAPEAASFGQKPKILASRPPMPPPIDITDKPRSEADEIDLEAIEAEQPAVISGPPPMPDGPPKSGR